MGRGGETTSHSPTNEPDPTRIVTFNRRRVIKRFAGRGRRKTKKDDQNGQTENTAGRDGTGTGAEDRLSEVRGRTGGRTENQNDNNIGIYRRVTRRGGRANAAASACRGTNWISFARHFYRPVRVSYRRAIRSDIGGGRGGAYLAYITHCCVHVRARTRSLHITALTARLSTITTTAQHMRLARQQRRTVRRRVVTRAQ